MVEALIFLACAGFIGSVFPFRYAHLLAAGGWVAIVAALFTELPYYFSVNNFLYPTFAVLAIPFLAITLRHLFRADPELMQLSRAAALAFLIYAPFAFIPSLGDWLINLVVGQVIWMLEMVQLPVSLPVWNIVARNGFRTEIILGCTGIQSIAILLGVAAGVRTTLRQKVAAFLLIAPVIYFLNLVRNTFVIAAYTEQWFPYLSEIASNGEYGYESFFWAHNVISEILALFVLIALAYELFIIIPGLGDWANDLYTIYRDDVLAILQRLRLVSR
ncbi:MAG: archaeosortase A [Methanomicrobiales archaeon]|nr:archaeosortase A [Methanomicrobiales archaeon]